MSATPITDQLREHLAEHPGDTDAIVAALAKIEEKAGEFERGMRDAVPFA